MSLATRCTHCGTIFKVVEDQLKVSEGWVRCGRCHQVFHAIPTLFDLEREAPPPRQTPAAPAFAPEPTPAPEPQPEAVAEADNPPSQPPSEWPATMPPTEPGALAPLPEPISEPPHAPAEFGTPDGTATASDATPAGPRIGPQPAPPQTRSWLAPVPATTDFDLDTHAEAPPHAAPPAPPPAPAAPITPGLDDIDLDLAVDLPPLQADAQPAQDHRELALREVAPILSGLRDTDLAADSEPPSEWDSADRRALIPSTEESDALDSRYLLPSKRKERPAARRPSNTPDFADAEVPDDWLLDAEEAFAEPAPSHAPASAPAAAITVLAEPSPPDPSERSTIPSRFLEDIEAQPQDAAAQPEANAAPQPTEAEPRTGLAAKLRKASSAKAADAEPAPEFIQRAQSRARWRHPAVRAGLTVLALGLVGLLAGQVAHQFRNELAAYQPELRPQLAQWCEFAGCELHAPLRIEDLQVDSLTFVRATSEGPDVYRLTVVLHNKAPIDLAWPHIDLSLTDLSGGVVLRKVFNPQDAAWQDSADTPTAPIQQLPAAAPAQRSTTLQWRMKIPTLQPAGYTADIFYP